MKVKKLGRSLLTLPLALLMLGGLLALSVLTLHLFGLKTSAPPPIEIEYTLTLRSQPAGTHEYLHTGDRVIDRTNRRLLGTVVSVESGEETREVYNESAGALVMRKVPGEEYVRIVIVADSDTPYTVADKTLAIGTPLSFRTRDFYGSGTVERIRER